MRAKMSAAGRDLVYGPLPPPPEDRPEAARYTITNCGIGWRKNRSCSQCKHYWNGVEGLPVFDPECWHPLVKREKPYVHGPIINEKREADDGCCPMHESI